MSLLRYKSLQPVHLFLLIIFSAICSAQEWYGPSLKISNKTADTTQNIQTLRYLLVYYQRLSESEPQLWVPYYYQSYIHYKLALDSSLSEDKSEHLKKAYLTVTLCIKSFEHNIEVKALYILIANECLRSVIIENSIENHNLIRKAIDTTSENPRMLIAQTMYFLSEPINNRDSLLGIKSRLTVFYNNASKTFSGNEYSPSWGIAEIEYLLDELEKLQ